VFLNPAEVGWILIKDGSDEASKRARKKVRIVRFAAEFKDKSVR